MTARTAEEEEEEEAAAAATRTRRVAGSDMTGAAARTMARILPPAWLVLAWQAVQAVAAMVVPAAVEEEEHGGCRRGRSDAMTVNVATALEGTASMTDCRHEMEVAARSGTGPTAACLPGNPVDCPLVAANVRVLACCCEFSVLTAFVLF